MLGIEQERGDEMLMATDNRHVMVDERGREHFWHPTRRKWLPGHKEPRAFVWDYCPARFYDRLKHYTMLDGSVKDTRVTRYTYAQFKKADEAPVGRNGKAYKRALKVCMRCIHYDGERFYKVQCVQVSEGVWVNNTLVPFTGEMWDCRPSQSEEQGIPVVSILANDGYPYAVVMDGQRYDVMRDEWRRMYSKVLCLRGA